MSAHKWPEQPVSSAKANCIRQLSIAYESHAESEQVYAGQEKFEMATIEHGACAILLRAMVAEDIDPKPKGLE